jgi:hypothetical protein
MLIITANAFLKLQNCRGTGEKFKGGNMTLSNPFDTELVRCLSDCSNWGLSSHQISCRTFNMTVSCSSVFSSGGADSRYFINEEDNKLKVIKGKVGRVRGIKKYRKSKGKDPPVLTLGVGWR